MLNRTAIKFVATAIILGIGATAPADILHLKDGGQISGDVKRDGDGWKVITASQTIHLPADQVDFIELTGAPAGPVAAATRLASLRRVVENLSDLPDIVSRFQRLVDTTTDPATLADAKKDLALWQDRAKQKMVKVGSQWVLPRDRQKLIDQSMATTEQARQLVKQGRTKEADPLLTEAIKVNPQNAAALYLQGVIRYQQDQVIPARKLFESVAGLVPNHAATLNNLAATQWRQRQYIPALVNYDAAMLASPVNKQILDNVASALLALPAELQKSPVYARTLRHFQEQDQQLSEQLSSSGLHRYGAVWLADRDMEQIHVQEKQIQDKLDVMSGDFDRCKARIAELESEIAETEGQINRLDSAAFVTDPRSGSLVQIPLPATYYDLQRDDQKIRTDRANEIAKLDALTKQAQELQRSRPSVRYAGTQRIFGAEGTPSGLAATTHSPRQ